MKLSLRQKIFLISVSLAAIFLLSFHYAFLTDFPIGHDAGHHAWLAIQIQKSHFNFHQIFNLNLYPVPVTIFAFLQKLTGLAWPSLFIYCICFFLFLLSLFLAYFTTKTFNNWQIGIASGIVLASSRWISDALRIGFFAEIWGLFVFILSVFFLVKKKFWALLASIILLFFSHPLVLSVFLLTLLLYSLAVLFSRPQKEDKLFLAKLYSSLILIGAGALIFYPKFWIAFQQLTSISHLEGGRNLKEMMIDSDKRRILIYLMSLVGLVKSVQFWKRNEIKYLFVLLFVAIILSQLYLWGINFWVFRFYPYFEMATSIFAALGIYYLIELIPNFFKKKIFNQIMRGIILGLVTFLLIIPNLKVNKAITFWQKNNYQLLAICPPQDRKAFFWIRNHTSPNAKFLAPPKWGAWLGPLADRKVIEWDAIFYPLPNFDIISQQIKSYHTDHIYFSSVQPENPLIEKNLQDFQIIYQHDGVRIYQVINKQWLIK